MQAADPHPRSCACPGPSRQLAGHRGQEELNETQTPRTQPSCSPLQTPENRATPWSSPPRRSEPRRCPTWWWETVFSSHSAQRQRKPRSRTSACACETEVCVSPLRGGLGGGSQHTGGVRTQCPASVGVSDEPQTRSREEKTRASASVPNRGGAPGFRPRVTTAPAPLSQDKGATQAVRGQDGGRAGESCIHRARAEVTTRGARTKAVFHLSTRAGPPRGSGAFGGICCLRPGSSNINGNPAPTGHVQRTDTFPGTHESETFSLKNHAYVGRVGQTRPLPLLVSVRFYRNTAAPGHIVRGGFCTATAELSTCPQSLKFLSLGPF